MADDTKTPPLKYAAIELTGIRIFAYHGVEDWEKQEGRWFEVDCRLTYTLDEATVSDNLSHTLNYAKVAEVIHREMAQTSDLIEHVAGRIVRELTRSFPLVSGGRLKVAKLNPPGCGETRCAAVILEW